MKKITLLIALMITSLGFSQTPEGTWKFTPAAGSFIVSTGEGATGEVYYQNGLAEVSGRSCLFDDEYVFNTDASFQNVLQTGTWLEPWQGVDEGCGAPIAPHDGSNSANWEYANGTVTVTGAGAFLGLNKAINGAQLTSLDSTVPDSRTYKVAALTETTMTLDIEVGGIWWRFKFTKKLVGQPTIGALAVPAATEGDAPFDLVNPESDSSGSFSYTSSDETVATITGNTVYIVGPGTTTITCTQAASAPWLTGSVSAVLIVHATPPEEAAPVPPLRNAADVISIFSGAYTDLEGTDITQAWGQSTLVDEVNPGNGDVMKRMEYFTYQGVVPTAAMDVSDGYKLHMDIYKTDMTSMDVYLINPGPTEAKTTLTPAQVGWNSFDIEVNANNFPGIDLTTVFQMKLVSSTSNTTTYFDNLYFWKGTALGVAKFDASSIKIYPNPVKNILNIEAKGSIERVAVYSILGQEVMSKSPKSNLTTLQTSGLQKGTYIVKSTIDGKAATSKFIKE